MTEWQVITGDCRAVLKSMVEVKRTFHAVIADPPYRIAPVSSLMNSNGTIYGIDPLRYDEWVPLVHSVLKPGGSLYVFESPTRLHELTHEVERAGFRIMHTLIWYAKNRHTIIRDNWSAHYDVCVYAVEEPWRARTWNSEVRGNPLNIEDVFVSNTQRNPEHVPGAKPLDFIRKLVQASTNPGDWVLDPFLGSGTTLRACMHEGRNGVGIEVRPEVAESVRKRLASASLLAY